MASVAIYMVRVNFQCCGLKRTRFWCRIVSKRLTKQSEIDLWSHQELRRSKLVFNMTSWRVTKGYSDMILFKSYRIALSLIINVEASKSLFYIMIHQLTQSWAFGVDNNVFQSYLFRLNCIVCTKIASLCSTSKNFWIKSNIEANRFIIINIGKMLF